MDEKRSTVVDEKGAGSLSRPDPLDSSIVRTSPAATRLKLTEAFSAVYRRGRWARGASLSVGTLPNREGKTRVGLRTRRGLKGAVIRNRLKRQLRAILFSEALPWRGGVDIVIVIHPEQLPARTDSLEKELIRLCRRANVLS